MGELFDATAALDARVHMPTYARKPVMFVRGEGMRLYDDAGREYLDFLSGIGVVNLGHAHPAVADAVCAQMTKLVHVSNLFYVEHRDELAERIVGLFGGGAKVFFANSGAEANEGAIKLARRYGKANGGEGCTRIISAERSFHGRTLATLAATGQPSKQEAFEPLPTGFTHVPLNDIDALFAEMDQTVCAVLLEPIQGESGVFECDPAYLGAVRTLCDERGVLLIFDEVQTGFFRTGTSFAWQGYGVKPDIMTLAKGMANGLPIGAVVAIDSIADAFGPGDHGSTFGGGPVVCAAALATINTLETENLGENSVAVGAYMRESLQALAAETGAITDVRGRGLMVGITLAEPNAARIASELLGRGIVALNVGDSMLRFLPPLVCSKAEIDTLLETLSAALGSS
jgi:predicted acetylornithine/succinylornithine family transaminase